MNMLVNELSGDGYLAPYFIYEPFKFSICIHEIKMQGSVSPNFDIGHSYYFMKYRIL